MNDAFVVRVAQSRQDLADDPDGFGPRNALVALESRAEPLTFERLHHEIEAAVFHHTEV
jgi:hypothetical protein